MAGNVIPSPVFTALDNNGVIVPGGKLYSWAAGSIGSVAQDTYTSSSLGTPNANPVVMDAAGRKTIFLDPTKGYGFVLKTAADVTLWTVDNVALALTNGSVTLAMLANLAQDQFIGRVTASTGVPETATITAAARTVLAEASVSAMVNTLGGAAAVGTGALVRANAPAFTAVPTFVAGGGTDAAKMSGVIHLNTTAVGSSAAGSQTLMSYTLPANSFNANGKIIRMYAWGTFAANANSKNVVMYFGTQFTISSGAQVWNNNTWVMETRVFRTGASTQTSIGSFIPAQHAAFLAGSDILNQIQTPTETDSATIVLAVKSDNGTATASDTVCKGFMVEFLN